MLKIVLPVLAVISGAVGAAVLVSLRRPVQSAPPPEPVRVVRTMTVAKEPVTFEVRAFGVVTPRSTTTLTAEVTGRIVEVDEAFVAGAAVEDGQVLLRVDPSTYEAAVAGARAELARNEAALARENAEADLAKKEWERFGLGEPSELTLRGPQLAEARATVDWSRARLATAEIDLARTVIRAPYEGRIREKRVEQGQYIGPGTALAVVYATDYAEVRLAIPPDEAGYLDLPLAGETLSSKDAPRVVLLSSFGGREIRWTGWITRTEGEVDERTRSLYAVARIRNPYEVPGEGGAPPLLAGLFVEAIISGTRVDSAARLPRSALEDGALWIVDAEEHLRRRAVTVLRIDREEVLVGEGVAAGDRVCVSHLDLAVDGMKVRVATNPASGGTP